MTLFLKFTHIFIINLTVGYASSMCVFLLKEGVYGSSGKIVHLFYQYLLGDVLGWIAGNGVWCWEVCWQAHSASTSMGGWKEAELNCDAVTVEVWADPMMSCGARMALQSLSWVWSKGFCCPVLSRAVMQPWVVQLQSAASTPVIWEKESLASEKEAWL